MLMELNQVDLIEFNDKKGKDESICNWNWNRNRNRANKWWEEQSLVERRLWAIEAVDDEEINAEADHRKPVFHRMTLDVASNQLQVLRITLISPLEIEPNIALQSN